MKNIFFADLTKKKIGIILSGEYTRQLLLFWLLSFFYLTV